MGKLTIRDFLDLKGQCRFTMTTAMDYNTARAAELAGIHILVTGGADYDAVAANIGMVRMGAPSTLITAGLPYHQTLVSDEEALRGAARAMSAGADMVYLCTAPERVAAVAEQRIPVHCHVGNVPSTSTWRGGLRAVGKTAGEALDVYRETQAYAKAGAVLIEMECVPHKVATEITKRVEIPVISMGSGDGCDGQYLFSCDILGTHEGHYPRHSRTYRNFFQESVNAFREFKQDVETGAFPDASETINIEDEELQNFLDGLVGA